MNSIEKRPYTGRTDLWTEEECALAARIYRTKDHHRGSYGRICKAIAQAIGRTRSGVSARFQEHGPQFIGGDGRDRSGRGQRYRGAHPFQPHYITPELHVNVTERALAARDVLSAARDTRDLTATLMGDPPPGFRALDGMQGLCHSRQRGPYLSAVTRSS